MESVPVEQPQIPGACCLGLSTYPFLVVCIFWVDVIVEFNANLMSRNGFFQIKYLLKLCNFSCQV